jgi:hypothetical protein
MGALIMTKADFRGLFLSALEAAAKNADKSIGRIVPRSFVVELHSPKIEGHIVNVDEALDHLYLGDGHFFRIVDVAIKEVRPEVSVAFVRVSGHAAVKFNETWNPADGGPFKQIATSTIVERRL